MDEALELQIRAEQERERIERETARGRVEGEHNARSEEAEKWRQRVDEVEDRMKIRMAELETALGDLEKEQRSKCELELRLSSIEAERAKD